MTDGSEFIVITGQSGAGRSQAANVLEDLGWFVIDNLPTELIAKVVELVQAPRSATDRVGLVIGATADQDDLLPALESLRGTAGSVRQLFLEASTEVLVRRYEESRRRHPLLAGDERLADAIDRERRLLEPVRAAADVVVDTSELNVHDLRGRLEALFAADEPDAGPRVTVVSFGYKHGLPLDVDMVFDCRFLPNPHWVDELRPLTGRDQAVRDHVVGHPQATEFLGRIDELLGMLLPAFVQEGKAYLSIAFGCTGGRHRSVAIADEVASLLRGHGFSPTVIHRDTER